MNIIEATRKAIAENKYICRESAMFSYRLKPTNDCCGAFTIISIGTTHMKIAPHWNPTADDILADDWAVFDATWSDENLPWLPKTDTDTDI